MTDKIESRLAVLETKAKDMAADVDVIFMELRQLNKSVTEICSSIKFGKWILGVVIGLGPILGVILASLIQK